MAAPMVSAAIALLLQDEPNLTPDQVKYRLTATANKTWTGYNGAKSGAGYLDVYAAVRGTTTQSANTGLKASQLLTTGSTPITWNSVGWNSVGWNTVGWNTVGWNTVGWNTVGWNSDYWGQ
jgi:serine protease AprX